jgi:hypothetical protein
LLALGFWDGSVLAHSYRQRVPNPKRNPDHPDERQTQQDVPRFQEQTSDGVCFHAPTLIVNSAQVLIERTCRIIEASDDELMVPILDDTCRSFTSWERTRGSCFGVGMGSGRQRTN